MPWALAFPAGMPGMSRRRLRTLSLTALPPTACPWTSCPLTWTGTPATPGACPTCMACRWRAGLATACTPSSSLPWAPSWRTPSAGACSSTSTCTPPVAWSSTRLPTQQLPLPWAWPLPLGRPLPLTLPTRAMLLPCSSTCCAPWMTLAWTTGGLTTSTGPSPLCPCSTPPSSPTLPGGPTPGAMAASGVAWQPMQRSPALTLAQRACPMAWQLAAASTGTGPTSLGAGGGWGGTGTQWALLGTLPSSGGCCAMRPSSHPPAPMWASCGRTVSSRQMRQRCTCHCFSLSHTHTHTLATPPPLPIPSLRHWWL